MCLHSDLVYPIYQIVYKKNSVYIYCNSFGRKTWFKDAVEVSNSLLLRNDIFISKAYDNHIGVYTCRGTLRSGSTFEINSTLLVAGMIFLL